MVEYWLWDEKKSPFSIKYAYKSTSTCSFVSRGILTNSIHCLQMRSTGLMVRMLHLLILRSSSPCCWDRTLWKGWEQVRNPLTPAEPVLVFHLGTVRFAALSCWGHRTAEYFIPWAGPNLPALINCNYFLASGWIQFHAWSGRHSENLQIVKATTTRRKKPFVI